MSHFVVLVIGENIDEQLEPFAEDLEMEPYSKGEVPQDEIDRFVDYYKEKGIEFPTVKELYEKKGKDWNGGSWRFDGDTVTDWSTYNPDSKWDWYSIGGRWTGYFKPLPGKSGKLGKSGAFGNQPESGHVDQIRKGDLDIEFMRDEAGKKAGEMWDLVDGVIGHLPKTEPWKSVRERISDISEARTFYHAQPRVVAVNSHEKLKDHFVWGNSVEDFDITREQYVTNARNGALSTFAVLKDGEWFEKGNMGWWGMVSNETDQNEWDVKFNQMLDELPDDTLLTIVDCHI